MRRLLQRAFGVTAAVSMLLFAGACVLWARSYGDGWRVDGVTATRRAEWKGAALRGEFWFERDQPVEGSVFNDVETEVPCAAGWSFRFRVASLHGPLARLLSNRRFYGEALSVFGGGYGWWGVRTRFLVIPAWAAALAALTLPSSGKASGKAGRAGKRDERESGTSGKAGRAGKRDG